MKKILPFLFLIILFTINSCNVYNFTGTGKIDAKTFQVNFFQNTSELVQPGIDRTFTLTLQDLIQNQTNLNLVKNGGDLTYQGEIIDYRITPMMATADIQAAQNRLNIRVKVQFTNKNKEADDFDKTFEFFYDYPAAQQLESLAKW